MVLEESMHRVAKKLNEHKAHCWGGRAITCLVGHHGCMNKAWASDHDHLMP